jgi:hypothetical protein
MGPTPVHRASQTSPRNAVARVASPMGLRDRSWVQPVGCPPRSGSSPGAAHRNRVQPGGCPPGASRRRSSRILLTAHDNPRSQIQPMLPETPTSVPQNPHSGYHKVSPCHTRDIHYPTDCSSKRAVPSRESATARLLFLPYTSQPPHSCSCHSFHSCRSRVIQLNELMCPVPRSQYLVHIPLLQPLPP